MAYARVMPGSGLRQWTVAGARSGSVWRCRLTPASVSSRGNSRRKEVWENALGRHADNGAESVFEDSGGEAARIVRMPALPAVPPDCPAHLLELMGRGHPREKWSGADREESTSSGRAWSGKKVSR